MEKLRKILYLPVCLVIILSTFSCRDSGTSSADDNINRYDEQGRKEGPWTIYRDSTLIAQGSYDKGLQDGLWTFWYPNGVRKEEGNFENGVKTGIWCQWYRDGELMWKGEYENGERQIEHPDTKVEIKFTGDKPEDNVLIHNHRYEIRIRIENIPSSHLFVETSKGKIENGKDPDLFILETPEDTSLTLAIGYIQTFEFKDFRHLVREIEYTIR
jgi:hypothetical protein